MHHGFVFVFNLQENKIRRFLRAFISQNLQKKKEIQKRRRKIKTKTENQQQNRPHSCNISDISC